VAIYVIGKLDYYKLTRVIEVLVDVVVDSLVVLLNEGRVGVLLADLVDLHGNITSAFRGSTIMRR
jgi:hypothetical protein